MPGDTVAIAFTADVAQLQAGANQASTVVASTTREMGKAAGDAHGGFSRLTEMLQHHRREVRAESGLARVLARDLSALGLEAKGAGGEIAHLVSVLAISSGPWAAAIAGMTLLHGLWKEIGEAEKEATRRGLEYLDALEKIRTKGVEDLQSALRHLDVVRAEDEVAKQRVVNAQRLADAEAALKKAREARAAGPDMEKLGPGQYMKARAELQAAELAAAAKVKDVLELNAIELARVEVKSAQDAAKEKIRIRNQELDEAAVAGTRYAATVEAQAEEAAKRQQVLTEMRLAREKESEKERIKGEMEQIKTLSDIWVIENEKQERLLSERRREIEAFAQRIGNVFANAIEQGKSPAEAMRNVLKEVEKEILAAAVKFLVTKAAEAFAAAFVSQASIPVVGPELGAAEGAAAQATILGLLGSLPSYAKGSYYIPHDQVAYLHKGEEVRTEQEVAYGGRGRGGDSFTIVAMDARSVERVFEDSESAIARADRRRRRSRRGL